eukprot:11601706-Alexandrium_andersonii.AAC.1
MSASLVGSEMCIRDRSLAEPARRRAAAPRPRGAPRGLQELMARALLRQVCLLYTSDAADDM